MKIGRGTSYWPTISQPAREIAQDAGRVSYLKPITQTKPITRKEKTNETK